MDSVPRPGLGIVTALPVEFAAMRRLLDDETPPPSTLSSNQYLLGTLPSAHPAEPHQVALTLLPRDGTRIAAAACGYLLARFPTIRAILMVGIAGGIPAFDNPSKHVRLGDIVVATDIVDYGHVRSVNGSQKLRGGRLTPPSLEFTSADRRLQADEYSGSRPWERWLTGRPAEATDVLTSQGTPIPHPDDSTHGRRPGFPRVHHGIVASGDKLVKDEVLRNELAEVYGACAIEMEAVGVATSTELGTVPWFMVRGIVDYCDDRKSDHWHSYASIAAAAYARELVALTESVTPAGEQPAAGPTAEVVPRTVVASQARFVQSQRDLSPLQCLGAIVDALLGIDEVRNNASRPMLLSLLPRDIQTIIGHQANARLEMIAVVRACAAFREGRDALVEALRFFVPMEVVALERAELVIEAYWHGLTR